MRIINIGCFGGKHVKELLDEGHDAYGADIDTSRFIPEIKDRLFKLDITKPLPKTKPFNEKFDNHNANAIYIIQLSYNSINNY